MNCQLCDEEPAAFTIIPAGQGDPQILGAACFARAGLELAKAILPAEEIAAQLGPMFVHSPQEAEAELGKARRKGGKSKPAPAVGAEPGPPGDPEVVAEEGAEPKAAGG